MTGYSTNTILSSVTIRQRHILSWKVASPGKSGLELILLFFFFFKGLAFLKSVLGLVVEFEIQKCIVGVSSFWPCFFLACVIFPMIPLLLIVSLNTFYFLKNGICCIILADVKLEDSSASRYPNIAGTILKEVLCPVMH